LLVKALDWQNSEEIAERLKAMLPAQAQGGLPPELQEQIEGGKQHIQEQDQEIQKLNVDLITAKLDGQKKDIEIARLKAMADISGALNKIETAHQVEAAKQPSLQAG
jgi:predicted aspartyl protease